MNKVKTSFGTFHTKWTDNLLSVGGKDWCVQLDKKEDGTAMLEYLGTENKVCELSGIGIKGDATKQMTYLAFTIFRKKYPDITTVNLIDTSNISCSLRWPRRRVEKVGLMKINLLLKGYTYYQEKFDAYPQNPNDIEAINIFTSNRKNPSFKKASFNFINQELQEILQPMYDESNTWEDFFIKLYNKFKRDSCIYMYPWFLYAFAQLSPFEITTRWQINIDDKPKISYVTIEKNIKYGGGKRSTRKNVWNKYFYLGGEALWNPSDIRTINYKQIYADFVKNNK